MQMVELNALQWKNRDDFYSDLLPKIGAPSWHGHNLDALYDSIFGGDINAVEPPFRVVVSQTSHANSELQSFLREVQAVFEDGRRRTDRDARLDIFD